MLLSLLYDVWYLPLKGCYGSSPLFNGYFKAITLHLNMCAQFSNKNHERKHRSHIVLTGQENNEFSCENNHVV